MLLSLLGDSDWAVSKCSLYGRRALVGRGSEDCDREMGKEPWRLCGPRTHLVRKENGHVSEEEGTETCSTLLEAVRPPRVLPPTLHMSISPESPSFMGLLSTLKAAQRAGTHNC